MAWDIHGNPLKRGYCEVHSWVAEEYPCSLCEIEDQKREFQREREVFQDRAQKDIWNDYVSPLQSRIRELEAENEELRKDGQWISVKERLPFGKQQRVIFFGRFAEHDESQPNAEYTGVYDDVTEMWYSAGHVVINVTHWQPLPSKPENK